MNIPPTIKVILQDQLIDWEDEGLESIDPKREEYLSKLELLLYDFIKKTLDKKGVSSSLYTLGGDGDFGRISIKRIGYFWLIYVSEKGKKYAPNIFRDCDDAVAFFIAKLDRSLIDWSNLKDMEKEFNQKNSHLL
jgi:hypothetical protein